MTETSTPQFSLVVAAFDVARYLPGFIASVEIQAADLPGRLEVVVVDDGSSDGTLEALRQWQARRPDLVTHVLSQVNAGQGAARNAGMDVARGDWVSFPDPDDILEPDYLRAVATMVDKTAELDMVATNRVILAEATGEVSDSHPLRRHFAVRDRVRSLDDLPEYFHGSAPAAFYRLERIRDSGLRYDSRIRPNFEDGHFSVKYLLQRAAPRVGFATSARYQYRKRQDGTSTLQTSRHHPGRFTAVLRHGYLDALQTARNEYGRVPEWLQNFVIYELSWYFAAEDSAASVSATRDARDEFHELMEDIVALLDPEVVESFSIVPLRGAARDVLMHGYAREPWRSPYALVDRYDADQRLCRIVYRYTGAAPEEVVLSGGRPTAPSHAKSRAMLYQGRPLLRERILWVSSRRVLRLVVDGRVSKLLFEPPAPPIRSLPPGRLRRELTAGRTHPDAPEGWRERRLRAYLRSPRTSERFRDAWLLMDRVHNADDSAEHLFAYVRERRPDINAYFTVERGTVDWKRLRRRYGRRVIAHGSRRWLALMMNCAHLVSSHADIAVCRPPEVLRRGAPSFRFTFLQHGVIKDDLSGWLNHRPLDLFVTSTSDEYASVVGDDSPYVYTDRETKLTGLPRFDLLLEQAARFPVADRDLVVVCPTWRVWLVPPLKPGSQRREVRDDFAETEYVREWMQVLGSTALADAVRRHGLRLAFMPHPNMAASAASLDLPSHVEVMDFEGRDVREIFARTAVLLTDYSSVAFNAAYIDRPVVYFQFDRDQMAEGGHVGRSGYFDYDRDGFGPVTQTAHDAVAAAVDVLDRGKVSAARYLDRTAQAFPERDGRCRERVVAAVEDSVRRVG